MRAPIFRAIWISKSPTPGTRVYEGGFAFFQWVGVVGKVVRCHPLQHRGCGLPLADVFRNFYQAINRDRSELSIAALNPAIRNPVADRKPVSFRPESRDYPCGFLSQNERQGCF